MCNSLKCWFKHPLPYIDDEPSMSKAYSGTISQSRAPHNGQYVAPCSSDLVQMFSSPS